MTIFNFNLENLFIVTDKSAIIGIKNAMEWGTGDKRVMLAREIMEWFNSGSLQKVFTSEGVTYLTFSDSVIRELREISSMPLDSELIAIENGETDDCELGYNYPLNADYLKPYVSPKFKRVYILDGYSNVHFSRLQLGKWAKCKMFNHTLRA